MTEYWVSKKQYWCKYCSIWIRDDAPSRRQHETGLKHQGQKERYIRELYKNRNRAESDKAAEKVEMARIEAVNLRGPHGSSLDAAAQTLLQPGSAGGVADYDAPLIPQLAAKSHAADTHLPSTSGRPSVLHALQAARAAAASTSRIRPSETKDRWANYSTATQLGFDDEDTAKSSYEIEQEIKGRGTSVGAWEEVVAEPQGLYSGPAEGDQAPVEADAAGLGAKRKLGEYGMRDEEDHEDFRVEARGKRPARDPYDEDEWDVRAAIRGIAKRDGQGSGAKLEDPVKLEGFKREEWTGRLELAAVPAGGKGKERERPADGLVYVPNGGGWVSSPTKEGAEDPMEATRGDGEGANAEESESIDVKAELEAEDEKPTIHDNPTAAPSKNVLALVELPELPVDTKPDLEPPAAGGGLFKKRRPPPSGRKK